MMSSSSENRSATGTEHLIAGFFGGLIPTGAFLSVNSTIQHMVVLNRVNADAKTYLNLSSFTVSFGADQNTYASRRK